MPSRPITRRRVLMASAISLAGLTGCLSESPAVNPPTSTQADKSTTETSKTNGETSISALSVADFVRYPLAGTHPHVHRQEGTQYVIVRAMSPHSRRALRERLTLTLNGEPAPVAEEQPVGWETDTVDIAFAVSKSERYTDGQVSYLETEQHSLSENTLYRLNNPPVFEVSTPSVSPSEIQTGERTAATVQFDLRNTGAGTGTFGASLSGNFLSGSNTLTATLDAGSHRTVSGATRIIGDGDEATVRLDWGADEWTSAIPVVGTQSSPESSTTTPSPR